MNMDGISILNDAVGGVEVTVLEDLSDPAKNVELHQGETVTLDGKQAYVYIRSRDVNKFNSATDRLERQKQYIEGLVEKTRQIAAGSKSDALAIYDQIADYSVTNMAIGDLIYELKDYTYSGEMYSLPGEMVEGAQYRPMSISVPGMSISSIVRRIDWNGRNNTSKDWWRRHVRLPRAVNQMHWRSTIRLQIIP